MGRKSRKKNFKEEPVIKNNKFEDLDEDISDESILEPDDHYSELLDKIISFKFICEENYWPIMNKNNSVTIMMDYLFKSPKEYMNYYIDLDSALEEEEEEEQ